MNGCPNRGHLWMNKWMNEWLNDCMKERMNEWVNKWMNEWMNEWMNDWMQRKDMKWNWSWCMKFCSNRHSGWPFSPDLHSRLLANKASAMPCVLYASQRRTDTSDESCHSHFPPWKCHGPEWLLVWLRGSKWRNEWPSEKMTPTEWMNEWMSEWMNEWMNAWLNEWMNEWLNEWMNEWMKAVNECRQKKMRPFRLVNEDMSERLDSHSQRLRLFDIAKRESLAEPWRATNDSWMNESKQLMNADATKMQPFGCSMKVGNKDLPCIGNSYGYSICADVNLQQSSGAQRTKTFSGRCWMVFGQQHHYSQARARTGNDQETFAAMCMSGWSQERWHEWSNDCMTAWTEGVQCKNMWNSYSILQPCHFLKNNVPFVRFSNVHKYLLSILSTTSSKSGLRPSFFYDLMRSTTWWRCGWHMKSNSRYSLAHVCRKNFKKVVQSCQFFTFFLWNRALATTVSCTFCRPLSGSRREPAETDTLQRRPRTATLPAKTQGFTRECFQLWIQRSRSLTLDDVVDMMVRQLLWQSFVIRKVPNN